MRKIEWRRSAIHHTAKLCGIVGRIYEKRLHNGGSLKKPFRWYIEGADVRGQSTTLEAAQQQVEKALMSMSRDQNKAK